MILIGECRIVCWKLEGEKVDNVCKEYFLWIWSIVYGEKKKLKHGQQEKQQNKNIQFWNTSWTKTNGNNFTTHFSSQNTWFH